MPSHAVLDTPPQAGSAFPAGIDPVRFEVLRNALLAITEEMGATLRRRLPSPHTWGRWRTLCRVPSRPMELSICGRAMAF
jgi:hypothetical protein